MRYLALGGVAVALFALGVLLRIPLAPLRSVDSDLIGPTIGALRILQTGAPFGGSELIFGYGRDLGWLPLVLKADGLFDVAVRRAVLQALVAPVTFGATLVLLGTQRGALAGATLAGLTLAWSDDLWRVVIGHYQSYLGVEWGVVLLIGLALAVRGRAILAAPIIGLALPMMAFNVPYAASAVLAVPVALALAGEARRPRLIGFALTAVVALAVALPHILRLASPDLGGVEGAGDSLLGRFRQVGNRPGVGLLTALGIYLEVPRSGVKVLLGLGPVFALFAARLAPEHEAAVGLRALAWGTLATLPGGAALVMLAQHGLPWHWLPMMPLSAACLGGALALLLVGSRRRTALATIGGCLAFLLLLVQAERARPELLEWPADVLMSTEHAGRASRLLLGEHPPISVVGYQAEVQLARRGEAHLFPAFLDGWMAGRITEAPRSEAVRIYLEGPPRWLGAVATAWPPGTRILASGTHFVALEARDAATAREIGRVVCGIETDGVVRRIGAPSADRLPADTPRDPPAGLHPCSEEQQKDGPVRQRWPR